MESLGDKRESYEEKETKIELKKRKSSRVRDRDSQQFLARRVND